MHTGMCSLLGGGAACAHMDVQYTRGRGCMCTHLEPGCAVGPPALSSAPPHHDPTPSSWKEQSWPARDWTEEGVGPGFTTVLP